MFDAFVVLELINNIICVQINNELDAARKEISMDGDLLIDHKLTLNVQEKSKADGTVPSENEAAATSQVVDLLVNAYMSYCVWYKIDKF